jgi:hypothetical protein
MFPGSGIRTMIWFTPSSMAVICPPMEVRRSLIWPTVASGVKPIPSFVRAIFISGKTSISVSGTVS